MSPFFACREYLYTDVGEGVVSLAEALTEVLQQVQVFDLDAVQCTWGPRGHTASAAEGHWLMLARSLQAVLPV